MAYYIRYEAKRKGLGKRWEMTGLIPLLILLCALGVRILAPQFLQNVGVVFLDTEAVATFLQEQTPGNALAEVFSFAFTDLPN